MANKRDDFEATSAGVDRALEAALENAKRFAKAAEKNQNLMKLATPLSNVIQDLRQSSTVGQAAYASNQKSLDAAAAASSKNVASIIGEAPHPKVNSGRPSAPFVGAIEMMGRAFHHSSSLMSEGPTRDAALSNLVRESETLSNNPAFIGTKSAGALRKFSGYAASELERRLRSSAQSSTSSVGMLSVNPAASFHEDVNALREAFTVSSGSLASSRASTEKLYGVLPAGAQEKLTGIHSKRQTALDRSFRNAIEEKYQTALSSAGSAEEKRRIFGTLKEIPGFEKIGSKGMSSIVNEERRAIESEERTKSRAEIDRISSSMRDPSLKIADLQKHRSDLAGKISSMPEASPSRAASLSLLSKVEGQIGKEEIKAEKSRVSGLVGDLRNDYSERTKFGKDELPEKKKFLDDLKSKAERLSTELPGNKEIVSILRAILVSSEKTSKSLSDQTAKTERAAQKEVLATEALKKNYPIASLLAPLLSPEWKEKQAAAGSGGGDFTSKDKKKILGEFGLSARAIGKGVGTAYDSYLRWDKLHISAPRETVEAQMKTTGIQNRMMMDAMSFSPESMIKYAGDFLHPTSGNPFTGKLGIQRAGVYAEEETKRAQSNDFKTFLKDAAKGVLGGGVGGAAAGGMAAGPYGAVVGGIGGTVLGGLDAMMGSRYVRSSGFLGSELANKENALYKAETLARQRDLTESGMQQQQMKVAALSTYFDNLDRSREAAIAVGAGRSISAHLVGKNALTAERESAQGLGYGRYPLSPSVFEQQEKKSVTEGLLSGESVSEGILGRKFRIDPLPAPAAAPGYDETDTGQRKGFRPGQLKQLKESAAALTPGERATAETEGLVRKEDEEGKRVRGMVGTSMDKIQKSEWFFKYGISPAERTAMAGSVVPNMGAGLGQNAALVQKNSDSLTRQLFELGLAGVGSFEQQSGNMGRISSMTGKGGQQAFNELKKVMAEAVGIGMDSSQTGQKFANAALSIAGATKTADVAGVSEQLASMMAMFGGKGKDAERVQDQLMEGMAGARKGLSNPAIDAIATYRLIGKVAPADMAAMTTISKDTYTMMTAIPELMDRAAGKKTSRDLGPRVNALLGSYSPKTVLEALSSRSQSLMEVIGASGGQDRIDKAMKAIRGGMKSGKPDFSKISAGIDPLLNAMQSYEGFESRESALAALGIFAQTQGVKLDSNGMSKLMQQQGAGGGAVIDSSVVRAARVSAATAAQHLMSGGYANDRYADVIKGNRSNNRDIFQGTPWQGLTQYGTLGEAKMKEIALKVSAGAKPGEFKGEEGKFAEEMSDTVMKQAMKKSIEAGEYGEGGQRVYITNASQIGMFVANSLRDKDIPSSGKNGSDPSPPPPK